MALRGLIVWLALLWFAPQLTWATDDTPLQRRSEVRVGRLDNGLTYYIWPNPTPKGEAVWRLFVKSGSLNESDEQRGLAHYLEHMAFNGSRHFAGDAMVRFLERHGAKFGKDLNAHTTFDETVYKLQLPTQGEGMLDSTLLILEDWMHGLTLDAAEVERERGVIQSERLARSNRDGSTNEALVEMLFADSRYAERPTIGDTLVVATATRRELQDYYRQWYRPELMALAVVGDIDADWVEQQIRQRMGGKWAKGGKRLPKLPTWTLPPYAAEEARLATAPHAKEVELTCVLRLPASKGVRCEGDMRDYAMNALCRQLIRRRLAEHDLQGASYRKASIGRSSVVCGGDLWMMSVTLNQDSIARGITDFYAQQQQMWRYGFTTRELQRAKRQLLTSRRQRVEKPSAVASTKLIEELYNDYMRGMCCISDSDELRLMEVHLAEIDSAQVLAWLQGLDAPAETHYLLHGHPALRDQVPSETALLDLIHSVRQQEVSPYLDPIHHDADLPMAPALAQTHIVATDTLPEVQAVRWRMDNGSEVIYRHTVQEAERVPLVVTGFRPIGLYHIDTLDYRTALTASAVIPICGVGEMSQQELADRLTGHPVRMSMLVDKNRTGVSGSGPVDDAELLMRLLYSKWMAPRLDSALCQHVIGQLRKEALSRVETPDDLFNRQRQRLLAGIDYTNRPLTVGEIDSIRVERMLPLWDFFFGSAQGFTFILTGNMATDSVRPLADRWIGALPGGAKEVRLRHTGSSTLSRDTLLMQPTSAEKATVVMTWQERLEGLGLEPSTVALQRLSLALEALQEVTQMRLRAILREEMAKTYSVSVRCEAGLHPMPLDRMSIAFSCQSADVDTLLSVTRQELQRLMDEPSILAPLLEPVKQNLRKKHALEVQKDIWWTGYIRNLIYNHEQAWDFADRYDTEVEALDAVGLADLLRRVLRQPCLIGVKS